jgi:hypothetical protein
MRCGVKAISKFEFKGLRHFKNFEQNICIFFRTLKYCNEKIILLRKIINLMSAFQNTKVHAVLKQQFCLLFCVDLDHGLLLCRKNINHKPLRVNNNSVFCSV